MAQPPFEAWMKRSRGRGRHGQPGRAAKLRLCGEELGGVQSTCSAGVGGDGIGGDGAELEVWALMGKQKEAQEMVAVEARTAAQKKQRDLAKRARQHALPPATVRIRPYTAVLLMCVPLRACCLHEQYAKW
eukprot:6200102-Pleurochrysis_carterae.AAC.1